MLHSLSGPNLDVMGLSVAQNDGLVTDVLEEDTLLTRLNTSADATATSGTRSRPTTTWNTIIYNI